LAKAITALDVAIAALRVFVQLARREILGRKNAEPEALVNWPMIQELAMTAVHVAQADP
jgi:hypothetical protein